MNLLIKGMEMPDIENNKSIKAEIRNLDGKLELGIMTGGYYCSQQWTYYPIVSVLTPHGRLIDVKDAQNEIDKVRPGRCYEDAWALTVMDSAPTVIEAEEG
ncbi:MAG: hypothetical protein IJI40_08670 [Firmicutes bacterium]|nr:hypothetical protein [Bacillota bacterium]